jgi:cytochrome b6-f complex iron-sulfur subunit
MNRKDFLKFSVLALTGAAIGPAFLESCSKAGTTPQGPTVDFKIDLSLSANAALSYVGGYVYSNGVIVARLTSANLGFVALAQTCTHQGCTISFDNGSQLFVCPCHGGTFNLNGGVVAGPPPNPLKKYNITRLNNILTIKG